MTIDYSKWDNMDTDSEPEISPPSVPTPQTPTPAAPQSGAPATAAPVTSRTPGSIQAVIVRCDVERIRFAPWSVTIIQVDHPIPLVFHRVGTQSTNRADLDNQMITYLNIDSESGFAPPAWQSHVGTVLVARKDEKPLLPQHLEGVWMYCDYILDLFGEGEGAPTHLYNRLAFEEWWKEHCEEQKEFRSGTGGENDPDDWRAVRSPYEM
ncbi:hypothetical protein EDB81DRAFT_872409 [Dactylonectria macrodidyma]|uniref:Ectomycorrhiza-upregulated zf-mynd domain-containing protein n=1 Tax=Dactylonectria macrodidyma TaxID=307937 RepID=A0A9P9DT03_9HYPO|nr:hypothetical protein EDB81DRAFT_872409 [Dactylonectria macrodidyma]